MSHTKDQSDFMLACGQTVGVINFRQSALYGELIREESDETLTAVAALDRALRTPGPQDYAQIVAEIADGCIDTIYVCLGLLNSLGIDPDLAWDEVHASNLTKIDATTGRVVKDSISGKVLKPKTYRAPDMLSVVNACWGEPDSGGC